MSLSTVKQTLLRVAALGVFIFAFSGLFILGGLNYPVATSPDPAEATTVDHLPGLERPSGPEYGIGPTVATSGVLPPSTLLFVGPPASVPLEHLSDTVVSAIDSGLDVARGDTSQQGGREAWEFYYMWGISIVASFVVAGRLVNGWRLDLRRLCIQPRDRTLLETWRGGTRA